LNKAYILTKVFFAASIFVFLNCSESTIASPQNSSENESSEPAPSEIASSSSTQYTPFSMGGESEENAPPYLSNSIVSIPETVSVGTLLWQVEATDPEGDVFSMGLETEEPFFGMTAVDNSIWLTLTAELDYENDSLYLVPLLLSDDVNDTLVFISVHVLDINENAPEISDTLIQVYEEQEGPFFIIHFPESDADGDFLRYSFRESNDDYFWGQDSQSLYRWDSFDYETQMLDSLEIRVNDGDLSDTFWLRLEILDYPEFDGNSGIFSDIRDGQQYSWVRINSKVWMQENLNYDTLNGSASWCYENTESNCSRYGRLYSYELAFSAEDSSASVARGLCPSGFRIPTLAQWYELVDYVNDNEEGSVAQSFMEESAWSLQGFDVAGFSALPSGAINQSGGFEGAGSSAYWWLSESEETLYYTARVREDSPYMNYENFVTGGAAYSLRCILSQE
jgi:uncharacterized protein (TIGR02145 family)